MSGRNKFLLTLLVLVAVAAALVAMVIWLAGEKDTPPADSAPSSEASEADVLTESLKPESEPEEALPVDEPVLADVRYDPGTYTVSGTVTGTASPQKYRVILFIETHTWFVKPDFAPGEGRELSPVRADGSFSVMAYNPTAKEQDIRAARYAVMLVPESFAGIDDMNAYPQAERASLHTVIDFVPGAADESPPEDDEAPGPHSDAGSPVFSDVGYDSDFYVRGRVEGIANPADYRVILFILTDQWYVKPDFAAGEGRELIPLGADGGFEIRAYHPDSRQADLTQATQYSLLLVPADFAGISHMSHYDEATAASVAQHTAAIP